MHQLGAPRQRTHEPPADSGERVLFALFALMAVGSAGMLVGQCLTADAVRLPGITIDRLSAALTFLVGSIGAVTFRFSQRYLHGEPGRTRFLRWLAFTTVSAYVLMLSTHLFLLFVAWSLTSFGLHQLLLFYPARLEALRPARKKFLISRAGDLALVVAIAVVWQVYGTLDVHAFMETVARSPDHPAMTIVGLLLVAAALTKSAQFPFHSWLPETMEAPTPVSALMHAGIINAGGALLLRFAPLIVRVPEALFLLAIVGTATATLGMLAMWAQVKVKRTLAWSTVAQMGFMMVQCGLGAFPAALLHILGHGFYKAWSFLKSGEIPAPAAQAPPAPAARTLGLAVLGAAVSIPLMPPASWATGFSPIHSPGELALAAIVAMSVGQLWVAVLGGQRTQGARSLIRGVGTVLASAAVVFAAFALYGGAAAFLQPVLGELPHPSGPLAWAAASLPMLGLVLLTVVQAAMPTLGRSAAGRALYVHALHGFYFGAGADRLVDAVWNRLVPRSKEVARA